MPISPATSRIHESLDAALARKRAVLRYEPCAQRLTMLLLYACYEDLAFRVLTGNQQPDHSRISAFRPSPPWRAY